MSIPVPPFIEFLRRGCDAGGFGTDDVIGAFLPLLKQISEAHQNGLVAPLDGPERVQVDDIRLRIPDGQMREPRKNFSRISELQKPAGAAIEVIGESRRTADLDEGSLTHTDLLIGTPGEEAKKPVYVLNYVSWEHQCGHHDQLTDIFSLGLVLASLACSLDLSDPQDLELFVRNRNNLFSLNERLHPVIAGLIVQMTELNRHRRVQTLETVVLRLENYRDQSADFTVDFQQLRGFRESAPRERGQIILTHLRNRLFEISRRNRLIHFKPTLQTLNLTLASVPLLLDHRNIKAEQLFLWHSKIAAAISNGESITLGSYVRFEDAPYASSVLDQIIATERRDRQEFGFAQLRLVLCFLRWHNLKETPEERIHSPLLLLPVELIRKKGVRDSYVLKPLATEAEVNPALRHHLRQLYGLNLPEFVDLSETTMDAFHTLLAEQIRASEPGVTLRKHDRPQIELIHERAKQRLDQFRRRQRLAGRGPARFESFDYSYEKDRFRPLGLQLFLKRVKPSPLPFAQVAGKAPAPRMPHIVDPLESAAPTEGSEREKQFYAVKEPQGSGNPYDWDFDLCSLTLGNFNYRKMSLVRDYAALLEQTNAGKAFESIFSLQPRTHDPAPPAAKSMAEQFPIVDCDPTQTQAVARARTGGSYIIQGPPGTGKSQTITNLIADYVARGHRVLFVCEKRAAIDVVFHRLGRQGLDDLCCLIHDSQTDKRDFIRNLKQTYDAFLSQPIDETIDARRTELIRVMDIELAALCRWSDTLAAQIDGCSLSVRALLARLVELKDASVELDPLAREWVPPYAKWQPHAELLRSLSSALARLNGSPAFAKHSFRHLTERVLGSPQPLALITSTAEEAGKLLARLGTALDALGETVQAGNLGDAGAVVDYAVEIADLAAADALDLLNPRSSRAKKAAKAIRDWRHSQAALEKARTVTASWRKKLSPTDTAAALVRAQSFEKSFLRWLQPAFWQLRRLLNDSYDFSRHAVRPWWTQILTQLTAEHAANDAEVAALLAVQEAFGEVATERGVNWLENSPARIELLPPAARALHTYLLENPEATYMVENLAAIRSGLTRLKECLGLIMIDYATYERKVLADELRKLRTDLVWLPDVLPLLAEVLRLPAELQRALRRLPLSDRQMEAAMARQSYDAVARQDRAFEATGGGVLSRRIARLRDYHREWLGINARWIHQKVRREFLRQVQISSTPAAQLSQADKELKRLYATGRRELEHEFSKTMRHRSIRDLADDETGIVLRDLKPVWLMSPLSVSDTLPLTQEVFDVVIFDEASQILMEEAVPAVSRAIQIIVVGDEMQLPPTNFFSATRSTEESLGDDAETGAIVEDLDAESFLTQAARNLPATMLGWHYRSRSEALISYSNHAFYDGRLLTVPDQRVSGRTRREIVVQQADDARVNVADLLARSVSFHFLPGAVYESRRNTAEADYIARLLRELLGREDRPSIGIVAFSEAQQGEIESVVNRLGEDDPLFRNRLEVEYEREDEGQFNGLFVKNLENVQGDERDIIILSICYGYDRNRRMLMNFGPINQRGGEKRLNVIFSRARKHMAVVSSIKHFDITNDFNDGANCLRNFLEYSAAASAGDGTTARRVLQAANPLGPSKAEAAPSDIVATQIAAALAEQGWTVDKEVGHSTFRLPLAVRRADDDCYSLGILIDDDRHYAQRDLLERYLQRPGILSAFGWRLTTIYTKDWLQDPEGGMRQVLRALSGEKEPEPEIPDEATPPLVEELAAPYDVSPASEPPIIASVPMAKPLAAAGPTSHRRYVCTEDGSSKFWEVSLTEKELTVRFGRIGTKGQSQTRSFTTVEAAQHEQAKLIRSKVAKGYTEEPFRTDL
ncbi:MAG TPA: AAA domain-containing protein [Lacunisphaera sp.]|jgi:predicted DNA-binding WGR domain protein